MKKSFGVGLVMAASFAFAWSVQAAETPTLNLSFVKFNVTDQPAMKAFYMKAFGLTVQKTIDNPQLTEIILTDPKGLDLALVHYKDGHPINMGNANGPIGFYLKDVDAAYKSAMAAGGVSKSTPRTIPGGRVATVADPEGHEIELLHLD